MSKNNEILNNIIIEEITDEEYEIWQFEHSAEIATDFIYDEILTKLDKFENDNEDEKYIYGVATHGLFVSLVSRLGEMGYSEKELRKEIKTWLNTSIGHVLH